MAGGSDGDGEPAPAFVPACSAVGRTGKEVDAAPATGPPDPAGGVADPASPRTDLGAEGGGDLQRGGGGCCKERRPELLQALWLDGQLPKLLRFIPFSGRLATWASAPRRPPRGLGQRAVSRPARLASEAGRPARQVQPSAFLFLY